MLPAANDDLLWQLTKLQVEKPITINADLIAAYQAASSPHSIRAVSYTHLTLPTIYSV